MTVPNTMPLTDRLTSHLDEHLRQHIWNGPPIAYGGVTYEAVGEDEDPDRSDENAVVLRSPDGALYDVEIEVFVSWREGTP